MAEKKLVSAGFRVEESTLKKFKLLAEAEGFTESEFLRIAISNLIDLKRDQYNRLNSIFGDASQSIKENSVEHRLTSSSEQLKEDQS